MELLTMERRLEKVVLSLTHIFLCSVILLEVGEMGYNEAWTNVNPTYTRTET